MERKYLDFRSIRSRAPFLDVLSRYNVEVKKVGLDQFKAKCPLPSHSNDKETGTFCINTTKNIFCCKSDSCQKAGFGSKGNILDFVRLMEGVQAYEAAAKLDSWYPDGMPENQTPRNGAVGTPSTHGRGASDNPTAASPEVNHPLAFRLKGIEHEHPMIQSRGISIETARKFGVGHFPGKGSMAGRIVFELHENGAVIGFAGRAVSPELQPKWLLPRGLVKSFVYGLEFCDPKYPLILGESFWLPPFMAERGRQAASLMGTEMSPEQEAWLAPFRFIHLAFDNDEKGMAATEKIAARLKPKHQIRICRLME